MISKITNNLFIGEFSDIVDDESLALMDKWIHGKHYCGQQPELPVMQRLKELGITTIMNVMERSDDREEKLLRFIWYNGVRVTYKFEPVPSDGYISPNMGIDKLKEGLSFAYYELSGIFFADYQEKVLVHCVDGIDRAPFVVASYLYKDIKHLWEDEKGITYGTHGQTTHYQFNSLHEAYGFIKTKRPFILEHPEWIWWIE